MAGRLRENNNTEKIVGKVVVVLVKGKEFKRTK